MPVIFKDHIFREDLRAHRDWLFIFGDNEQRYGFGGQAAACRGEPNAVGVVTKKAPSYSAKSYWTNSDLERVKPIIDADLQRAINHLRRGGTVVIPKDGIGTGRARLPSCAPKIFAYIQEKLQKLSLVCTESSPKTFKIDMA